MKAAVLARPGGFELRDVEPPEEIKDWTEVQVAFCGVCGSDLAIYRRDPPIPKFWPGHEISGYRDEELVVVNPLLACGACEFCNAGDENCCPNARMVSHHVPGGFAERVYVPDSNLRPMRTSPERAALVEPVASSLHALGRAGDVAARSVLVIGGGTIGLLLVQLATLRGAARVALKARHEFQRERARGWGAVEADFRPDVILIAVGGDGEAFQYAIDEIAPRGSIVLIGNIYESRVLNLKQLTEHELRVSGSQRYTHAEFETAAQLIENEALDIDGMITRCFDLEQISDAYAAAADKAGAGSIKVLVRPGA